MAPTSLGVKVKAIHMACQLLTPLYPSYTCMVKNVSQACINLPQLPPAPNCHPSLRSLGSPIHVRSEFPSQSWPLWHRLCPPLELRSSEGVRASSCSCLNALTPLPFMALQADHSAQVPAARQSVCLSKWEL